MYIWVAVDVDEQLKELKEEVSAVTARLSCRNTALTLPFHVSLRISFLIDNDVQEEVLDRISAYYRTLSVFDMDVRGIEKCGKRIVWLKIAENQTLTKIHQDMIDFLRDEYRVSPHMFDQGFLYHASLLLDDDEEKIDKAYHHLKSKQVPQKLTAKKFIIGCSQTGFAGDFCVIREEILD